MHGDYELKTLRADRDAANAEAERLRDLVRYMRSELLDKDLISRAEYATLLVQGGVEGEYAGAVERLNSYDQVRHLAKLEVAEARAEAEAMRRERDLEIAQRLELETRLTTALTVCQQENTRLVEARRLVEEQLLALQASAAVHTEWAGSSGPVS